MQFARRYPYKKYLLIVGALLLVLSLPPLLIGTLRGRLFALFSPLMKLSTSKPKDIDKERLEVENHLLRSEIHKLRLLLDQEVPIFSRSVAARVIYRDPGSWSSVVWIDVGFSTDPLIQKNSPVVVGNALVGILDYVGKRQSRVRLISDMGLKPSVRALRGDPQNVALIEHINPLLRHLTQRKDLPLTKEEQVVLRKTVAQFKERLSCGSEGSYLAKGIIQGAGTPLWRSVTHTLRGIGFNYDFSDEKGAARPLSSEIIQVADLLVTTGLDGVFPEGLAVAEVTRIFPLREGAYTYEIEGVPAVGNLNALQTLFVIPPLGYDEEDQPGKSYT